MIKDSSGNVYVIVSGKAVPVASRPAPVKNPWKRYRGVSL